MYGHKRPIAWAALFDAMAVAGIRPIRSWPLHMERGSKFRHGKVEALATATLLVCRVSPANAGTEIEWSCIEPELSRAIRNVMTQMAELGLRKQDLLTAAIAPTMQEVLRYKCVVENGKVLSTVVILERILALSSTFVRQS